MLPKIVTFLLLGIMVGGVLALPITPIVCWLRKVFVVPFLRKKYTKKVLESGHEVTAYLIRSRDIPNDDNTDSGRDIADYQYEYNGRKYKYQIVTYNRVPDKINLYFQKNPKNATSLGEIGLKSTSWFKCYLVTTLFIAIIVFIMGVFYVA